MWHRQLHREPDAEAGREEPEAKRNRHAAGPLGRARDAYASLAQASARARRRRVERIDRTLDFLRAVPGVQQAATAASLPGVPG
jgi:hypothetical protein